MDYRHKIPSIAAFVFIIFGALVIAGWIFDIGFLRSINPAWTPMKFVTAICFVMSGLIIFAISRIIHGEFEIAPLVLSAASLVIIILTAVFFLSNFFKIYVGIEQLFIGEIFLKEKNIHLQPCSFSMLIFFIVAIVGILSMMNIRTRRTMFLIPGIFIGLIGLSAIAGHIMRIPFLYYDIYGISAPMSVISGPLFVLMGTVFYILYSCPKSG